MSIDTTVKVGFDGSAVKGGLKNIGGMFGKFSKEVGIGAARKVGEFGADIWGKALKFFAETPGMFMDYAGELKDLSTLTDVSINKLQILQEAFRLADVDSIDAGKSIGLLAKAIYEAREQAKSGEGGDMVDLFDSLKIGIGELSRMKPDEQIERIFAAMKDANMPMGQQFDIMQKLFGKGGIKMLKAFRDNFPATMQEAESNLASFGKLTKNQADGLEALGDQIGRLPNVKMALFQNLLNGIFGANSGSTAAGELKKIFDQTMLGGEKMEKFGKMLRNTFEYIGQGGFNDLKKDLQTSIGNFATDIGDKIGKSFSAAVDNYFKGTALGGMISKSSSPATANGLTSNQTEKNNESAPQLLKVVDILQKIYREGGGALFS
jgi:hypothetical protein